MDNYSRLVGDYMLEQLQPEGVFRYFEEISSIPRGSYNEKKISDYLVSFAKSRCLEHYQDEIGNVIIIKEASAGYEDKEPVILQGHMDMVCEKEEGCNKDMELEGLDLEIVDGFVTAKGTTLGGDDGIALAYALALLDSDEYKHPRLECVFTVSEEVGMDGAQNIDLSMLRGKRLINIDSEEEGTMIAGCAGGGRIGVDLSVSREKCEYNHVLIRISGLLGGHSGGDINLGRASAFSLAVRIITKIYKKMDIRLVSISMGKLINVIANSAKIELAVADIELCKSIVEEESSEIKSEYNKTDKGIVVSVEDVDGTTLPLTEDDTVKVTTIISSMPQGVQRMSEDIEGEVETSINWGVCDLLNDNLSMKGLARSQIDDRTYELLNRVSWLAKGNGASAKIDSNYPAWRYAENSYLRDKMCDIYKDMFHKELVVGVFHVGLECGFLLDKLKGADAVSIGPDIIDIHTPNEKMDIESVGRMWDYLLRVLEEV